MKFEVELLQGTSAKTGQVYRYLALLLVQDGQRIEVKRIFLTDLEWLAVDASVKR